MPTAARLVGAVCFAGLAFLVSGMIIPLLPDGDRSIMLGIINTGVGLFCGWKVMGPRAGYGFRGAIGGGLTTTAAMVIVALFIHSTIEMVHLSLRKAYDGATEAVVGIFEIGIEYAKLIATPEIIGTLLVGGILAAVVTNAADARWA